MVKENNTTININDVEYDTNDFTETQKVMFSHVVDLERKISNIKFNLDQLSFGKESFLNQLVASLESEEKQEQSD